MSYSLTDVRRTTSVRVLVVGDTGVGKTTLVERIVSSQLASTSAACGPSSSPALPGVTSPLPSGGDHGRTVGCQVRVKLQEHTAGSTGGGGGERPGERERFFVELWDVGGMPRYEKLRPIFYTQISGVILVHDLTRKRTRTGLEKWANEVSTAASFDAPSPPRPPEPRRISLPVPFLIVGNKLDVVARRRAGAGAAADGDIVSIIREWLARMLHPILGRAGKGRIFGLRLARRGRASEVDDGLPLTREVDGVEVSALSGKGNFAAVDAFFNQLLERRLHCSSRSSGGYSGFAYGSAGFSAPVGAAYWNGGPAEARSDNLMDALYDGGGA